MKKKTDCKPGDMYKKSKKKLSMSSIKKGVKKAGQVGKAFVRNVMGRDTDMLAKSWGIKKNKKKLLSKWFGKKVQPKSAVGNMSNYYNSIKDM